jgi:hypothetical protein
MEKDDGPKAATPGFVHDALTFLPRKWNELVSFLSEVKAELKKVTWPSWQEVRSTTVVGVGAPRIVSV